MIRAVKLQAVAEDETDVKDELVGIDVPRIDRVGVRLRGVRSGEFLLDSREIHGTFDDGRIMGNREGNGIDRQIEGVRILQTLESANRGATEPPLTHGQVGRPSRLRKVVMYGRR